VAFAKRDFVETGDLVDVVAELNGVSEP